MRRLGGKGDGIYSEKGGIKTSYGEETEGITGGMNIGTEGNVIKNWKSGIGKRGML